MEEHQNLMKENHSQKKLIQNSLNSKIQILGQANFIKLEKLKYH